jgi:Tfp pilus assembly protein PilZ
MDERRSEQRLEVCLDAVWDGHGNRPARILDLSEGGCFVDTTGEAYIGELLTFHVELPDGKLLVLTGEVAHHMRPVGFGLRFVETNAEQREQLLSFIEYLKKSHGEVRAVLR